MAKGLALPISVNGRGGARTVKATAHLRQTIFAGLRPNESMNPFQPGNGVEVGVSDRLIFAVNGPAAETRARRQIVRFFKRLRQADLAKLAPGDEGVSFERVENEVVVRVRYVDLEGDREDVLESNLRDGSSPGNVGGEV